MRTLLVCLLLLLLHGKSIGGKPRLVVSSDFPPVDVIPGSLEGPPERRSDPDDVQSLVRFLVYANEFEMAGLIAAAGTLANQANKGHLLAMLDAYDQVDEQLRKHDPAYPTADALRKVTKNGLSGTYGRPASEIIGEGKDSEASRYILELIKDPAAGPIWFCFWGGTQELAQALWRLRQTVGDQRLLRRLVSNIRVYMIARQDGTGQWLMDNFPDLFIILNQAAFKSFFYNAPTADPSIANLTWLNQHIRTGHGPLGALYPESGWVHTSKGVIEGDTPSFMYLYSGVSGLSELEKPWYGGWGGRFERMSPEKNHWIDAPEGGTALTVWQYARQNDFAARMDRCVRAPDQTNHQPVAVLNRSQQPETLYLRAKPKEVIRLDASSSSDPDGNELSYQWFFYAEASTYKNAIRLENASSAVLTFAVPADLADKDIHIILQVIDSGAPSLSTYRRVVIERQ